MLPIIVDCDDFVPRQLVHLNLCHTTNFDALSVLPPLAGTQVGVTAIPWLSCMVAFIQFLPFEHPHSVTFWQGMRYKYMQRERFLLGVGISFLNRQLVYTAHSESNQFSHSSSWTVNRWGLFGYSLGASICSINSFSAPDAIEEAAVWEKEVGLRSSSLVAISEVWTKWPNKWPNSATSRV